MIGVKPIQARFMESAEKLGRHNMVTLVTGFEPFGRATFNTSELVVRGLSAQGVANVVTAVLPTSYRRAASEVTDLLVEHRARMAVLLGQSRTASAIRLEQIAANLDDSVHADNDGEVRHRQPVQSDAPESYCSSLPLDVMVEAAGTFKEAVDLSVDAGGYVCNHVFFVAAHIVATTLQGCRCGFVHLPVVDVASDRLPRFVDIVRAWIESEQGMEAADGPR